MLPKCACLGLLLLLASACSPAPSVTNSVVDRDHDWSRVNARAGGFDSARLARLERRLDAGEFANVHMVLVERRARLVLEKYLSGDDQVWGVAVGFRKFDAASLHDILGVVTAKRLFRQHLHR